MYFKSETIEELKSEYKQLCKKYHPDICDLKNATEIMQKINCEYEKKIKEISQGNNDIISKIIDIDGIIIEIVGVFVWVSGNTYPHKEKLKELNYHYSANKKSWYYVLDKNLKRKIGTNKTLDQIKEKYGCKKISKEMKKIA